MNNMSSTPSLCTQVKTIGSLKVDWCGMRMWNAHVECQKSKTSRPQKAWHCKNVRNVMWSLKSKQNQNNAMSQNRKGYLSLSCILITISTLISSTLHTPPVERRLLLQSILNSHHPISICTVCIVTFIPMYP